MITGTAQSVEEDMSKGTVAIIGAGVGGLVAARMLLAEGFDVSLFESHDDLGGQWNYRNKNSGVWPTMRTNTADFSTKTAEMKFREGTKIFPRNTEVLDMINDFVDEFDLRGRCRFGCTVIGLERAGDGYQLSWNQDGSEQSETFDRVVVAKGRFNKPEMPNIEGLDSFTGKGGVVHAFNYKEPLKYRDMNIVVLGGSISSMEVASDQSLMGTGRVYMAQRRQRYVMPKMFAGTPLEYLAFTLEGAEAAGSLTVDELLAGAKEFLELEGGNPARYGAPAPHQDMAEAGVTGSQHYLNLVAEDRIDVRPWVKRIDGDQVTFEDGSTVQADVIIIGTGFELDLSFLSDDIAKTVNLTAHSIDLAEFSFHPDLPGLAFMGLFAQLGPYPVVLEQQARWIAYCWGGKVPMPSEAELRQGVRDCVEQQHNVGYREQHEMALRFARLIGATPDAGDDQELAAILPKCATTGELYRISGPDALPWAADYVKDHFWSHAPILTRREIGSQLGRDQNGNPV